jgi:hypothetical protein
VKVRLNREEIPEACEAINVKPGTSVVVLRSSGLTLQTCVRFYDNADKVHQVLAERVISIDPDEIGS